MIGPSAKDSYAMINDFFSTPLFMTEAPKDNADDPSLLALQSLLYDGTDEEVALNFKNQGNECMANKNYREALNYYTQGIQAIKESKLKSILLSNRAAAQIKLQNYSQALGDCSESIKLDHKNLKSFYRSIKALVALEKIEDAIQVCEIAQQVDCENSDFKRELKDLMDLNDQKLEKLQKIKLKQEEKQVQDKELMDALISRKIKLHSKSKSHGSSILSSFHSEYHVKFQDDSLFWPVLFLYPEYQESDFITSFDENTCFIDHLRIMFQDFPLWDVKNEYTVSNLQVYFETRGTEKEKSRLLKVSRNMSLKTVLSHSSYTVIDGIPTFFILSSVSQFTEKFIDSYKAKD